MPLLLQVAGLPLWALAGAGLGLQGPALAAWTVAMPLFIHVAILSAGFLRAAHGSSRPAADWLMAWLTELPNSLRVYYGLLPFRAGFRPPAPAAGNRLPILFLHGYGCNRGIWRPAAHWFARRGHPVAAIDLRPLGASIDDYAGAIQQAVDRLRADHGGRPVAIVAHSMGGLAARAWLRDCRRQRRASGLAALVTLGTPHQGTATARLGLGDNARQMRRGSDWIRALADEPPPEAQLTVVIGWNDNIVTDPLRQTLPHGPATARGQRQGRGRPGDRVIRVARIGHMRLATAPRLFRLIAHRLAQVPLPSPPDPEIR